MAQPQNICCRNHRAQKPLNGDLAGEAAEREGTAMPAPGLPPGRLNCPGEKDRGLPRAGSTAIRSLPGSFRLLPGCSQGWCEVRVQARALARAARSGERDARTACRGRGEGAERSAARSRQACSRRAGAMAATALRPCARWLAQRGCEPVARSSRATRAR